MSAPLLLGVGSLAACTGDSGKAVTFKSEAPATAVLPEDLPGMTSALTSALYEKADVVAIAPEDAADAFGSLAAETGLPLLLGSGDAVTAELKRLDPSTIVVPAGFDTSALDTGAEAVELDAANPDASKVSGVEVEGEAPTLAFVADSDADSPAASLAKVLASGLGASFVEAPGADPRATSESVAAVKKAAADNPETGVFGVGGADQEQFAANVATAATAPELPGGGQLVVPSRRMIAAYGSPGTPSLGILGEQDLPAAIERVKGLAKDYEPFSDVPVVPAFELIATVASASPGPNNDYSVPISKDVIREWVDGARDEGVYVVLDLQPGTTHFLEQAKQYEDLLKEPHVGLALDAEWRLKPGQKHLQQIGSVAASEVNEVSAWLADLTRDNNLPQKVFILHQFAHGMIADRDQVDASRPELAVMLHADGHGTPDLKMGTWRALQDGLPEGVHMAWKNFYDEDTPTFTPEQTYDLDPRPWFVSYQ